jgi:NhaP-type Na+/H+ or K+/H+ antiporter
LLGIIVGIGTIYWMKRVNNSSALTINVMYVSTYLTYFIAENVNIFFDANGLVSVITLGIYMSVFTRIKVRHESVYSLDVFW